jgi:hypothetical protein
MRAYACAVLVRHRDIVGADSHQPAISHFQLTVQFHEKFGLPPVLGTKSSPAEHQNHGMRTLQVRQLAALRSVIRELVVGKNRAWHNIRSHIDEKFLSLLNSQPLSVSLGSVRSSGYHGSCEAT